MVLSGSGDTAQRVVFACMHEARDSDALKDEAYVVVHASTLRSQEVEAGDQELKVTLGFIGSRRPPELHETI